MNTSEKTDGVIPALLAATRDMNNPAKNAKNPHFRNTYANLEAVIGAIRDALLAHGLFVTQSVEPVPSFVQGMSAASVLLTRATHESGQWVESSMPVVPGKPGPQEFGSALTYARRYGLQAAFNLVAADDDAETATGRGQYAQKPQGRSQPKKMESPAVAKETALAGLRTAYKRLKTAGGDPDTHIDLEVKDMTTKELTDTTTKLNNVAFDAEEKLGTRASLGDELDKNF